MRTVRELGDLAGRRVLLTGGAGHIGLACAESMIELGATVVVLDVDVRSCEARAAVLAPRVRVNAIAPGGVWRGQPDVFRERYEVRTPLRRMAIEEDLKGAVAYLASDLSSYVTGHTLVVDGGWTAW